MRRLRHDGPMELQTERLLLREYTMDNFAAVHYHLITHGRWVTSADGRRGCARLNVGADHPYLR